MHIALACSLSPSLVFRKYSISETVALLDKIDIALSHVKAPFKEDLGTGIKFSGIVAAHGRHVNVLNFMMQASKIVHLNRLCTCTVSNM